jgi:hypothetical protein
MGIDCREFARGRRHHGGEGFGFVVELAGMQALVDLLHEPAVGVIWPAGQVFERSDPPIAE